MNVHKNSIHKVEKSLKKLAVEGKEKLKVEDQKRNRSILTLYTCLHQCVLRKIVVAF